MLKKRTPRDYKFIRLLGEGSYSSVYLAVDADVGTSGSGSNAKVDGDAPHATSQPATVVPTNGRTRIRKYAIKVCQKSHIKRQGKQVAIMREKEIMNILNQYSSKYFIRLYCTFQDVERLFFVMSYAERGELLTYMLAHPLSLQMVKRFTLQLVEALEHLHKLDIVHRDLKPENILLSYQMNILISDFGSAQIYKQPAPLTETTQTPLPSTITTATSSSTTTTTTDEQDPSQSPPQPSPALRRNSFVGTAQYVSPEMLKNRQASNKSDLWALGVIIFQMITNLMPFDAPNEYLIYKKIQSLDYQFPANFDLSARDLVTSLIQLEPSERLGAQDDFKQDGYKSIRRHPFLATDGISLGGDTTSDTAQDSDLINIDKIAPGLNETQLLRLLTDG